ncbi:hypothetical protein TNCV_1208201 [Trichonephila clavipes]|nr:hypothetical protein TNCV_1208201 [Trichonephila clavipes]
MLRKKDGYTTQGIKIKIKRQKLENKKSLGGRNRLTDAEIDKLQRYYGLITKLKVLDLLNIQPGFYTCRALQEEDHARIRKAEKAISRRTKEARIKNRQLKCRQTDDLADDLSKSKLWFWTATAGTDVVQSGRPIFDDFFHICGHISAITRPMLSSKWSSVCGLSA